MFSMTKSRELDKAQSRYADVNKRHYGESVKFLPDLDRERWREPPARKKNGGYGRSHTIDSFSNPIHTQLVL